ncbi:MAG: Ppx/GppA family phosphatase [Sphingobium sp.]|nr:Ppx/GppA family phosphatase [Sphingobium sp.]
MTLFDRIAPRASTRRLPADQSRRTAIIDIGSNSIRLVVYDGPRRLPFTLFNEKVMAGLGAELSGSGLIGKEAMERALIALERFARLSSEMGVDELRCVATAAVRDAPNGPELIERASEIGLAVQLLSGEQEGIASAHGLLSGMPDADGIMGDLGGGSLELVRIRRGVVERSVSLPLGVLRVSEIRRKGKRALAQRFDALLKEHGLADIEKGLPFYMIGGSWRALARLDMTLTRYPLPIIHHYEMASGRAAALQRWIDRSDKGKVKALPAMSGARVPTLPDAAHLLATVVARLKSSHLTVSAFGLREGLLFEALPKPVRAEDPLLIAARAEGDAQGRFVGHGDHISRWIEPLFKADEPKWERIRHAACLLADVGWRANPEFRAERGLEVALHGNWVGVTAEERAVLAQALHANFGGGVTIAPGLTALASDAHLGRATQWGLAIRLCQRLSGGAETPLDGSQLSLKDGTIVLRLDPDFACLAGETVSRRLRQLGQAMDMGYALDC